MPNERRRAALAGGAALLAACAADGVRPEAAARIAVTPPVVELLAGDSPRLTATADGAARDAPRGPRHRARPTARSASR